MIRSRYKLLKWFLINIYKCSSSSLPLVISTQNRSRYLGWLHINFKSEFCEQSRNILNEIFSISSPKMLAVKWRVVCPHEKYTCSHLKNLQSSQYKPKYFSGSQFYLYDFSLIIAEHMQTRSWKSFIQCVRVIQPEGGALIVNNKL